MSRDISPSKEALSNRNLTLLLETFSKKETQKSLEALAKIDKDEWKSMAETAFMLNSFVALGGASELANILKGSIQETIKLQIASALSPLKNTINQAITDQIAPFLADILQPMINDLNTFLSANISGAGIGGIVGSIASIFLPGGLIWVTLGAVVGAAIEEYFKWVETIYPDESQSGSLIGYFQWVQSRPGQISTQADYKIWLANQPIHTYLPDPNDYRGERRGGR